ncbi:hypothetical protein MCOR31_005822 [Pyricularia oryzae]|nr:hypothetical protein MCOR01_006969 [Pyricularia oryzae]KAI6367880.1 hypothetical protein MCOR31_005822 [Pyricularia oryzae]KAI6413008.1 hypothetical protein MCOR24_006633 [Pyricularia oryzae]KAI6446099.1 hypothetical protein MCOR15_010576 [Pyricularia oryzae]KAI6517169.1 hypothetical protein MCOR16_009552 [Pyricularia oryzae]
MSATTSNDAADDELCDIMSLPPSIEDDDDDIDDVSTTSTVIDYFRSEGQGESDDPDNMDLDIEDPEKLWEIEAVAAERRSSAGKMRYLVHWVGFPIYRSTWEVAENFPEDGLENWEETKAEIEAGLKEPFKKEILRWRDAVKTQNDKRLKRNAKRKRLGLPFKSLYDYEQPFRTDWEMDLDELDDDDSATDKISQSAEKASEIIVCGSSSDEAEEDDTVDDAGSRRILETRQPQQRTNRIFKGIADSSMPTSSKNRATGTNPSAGNQPRKRVNIGGKSPASSSSTQTQSIPSLRPASTLPKPQAVTAKPSATGYQGTARRHTDQPRERASATGYQGTAQRATADGATVPRPAKSSMLASSVVKSSKGMTARRTVSRPTTMINVTRINISALRKPKRKSYLDSDADGAVQSNSNKRYVSLSTRRRVELRGRNKENDAPTAAEMEGRLFNPALGPPASKAPAAKPHPVNQTLASRKKASVADPIGQTTKTKRKSVHFAPDDDSPAPATFTGSQVFAEPEEMDVVEDSPTMNPGDSSDMEIDLPEPTGKENADPASPTTPARKVTLAEYQAAKTTPRSVQIKASFGSSSPLDVLFNGIPNDSDPRVQDQQWLKEFLTGDVLPFRHQCLAELLLKRIEQVRPSQKNHCSGSITGKDENADKMLTNVSERLKAGGNGLLLSRVHYAVLVYPAKCDYWAPDSLDGEEKESDVAVLRYILFTPADDISLMLQGENTRSIAAEPTTRHSRVRFMDHLFGLGESAFERLVPPGPQVGTGTPRFCLIFPLSCAAEFMQASMWIRACNPDAEVYTAHLHGSWRDFLSNLEPTSVAAVIVHEAALRTLRRLPKLRLFLENARYWVWRWPDKANLWNSLDAQPERLFPFGHLTLLTPSFVVSEPRLALETISEHVRNKTKAIMISHDFVNWVGDLAAEKSRLRQGILQDARLSDKERENKATMRGVSMDDCHAISQLATEMLAMTGPTLHRLPEESYTSNFIFAEQCVDDNDEQSLVNWFGWWSIANAEKFRKFNVLGTRNGSRTLCRKRAFLKIPSFSKNTINDPDGLLRKIREEDGKKEAELAGARPKPPDQPMATAGSAPPSVQQNPAPDLTVFRSERLPQETPKAFLDELNRIQTRADRKIKPGVWRLFAFPIYWKDGDELFQHGRINSNQDNLIRQWFDYTWAFDKTYRMYIGFCYMVEDSFNPAMSARGQRAPRRPWLVIYRINEEVVTEQSSRTPTEIIIVDPAAGMDTPGKYILEDCLPSSQQAVINHIRKHEPDKKHRDRVGGQFVFTHRMPPQKVANIWVAGMPITVAGLSPVDQCLRLAENLIDSLEMLPLSSERLARMGFKLVFKDHPSSTPSSSPVNDDNPDENPDSTELETKIVFHPPVPDTSFEGPSKCSNRLFEAARLARVKDKNATHMTYEYRPTVEWYEEQRLEGRGWEHVWVGTYEKLYSARQKTRIPTEHAPPAAVP